MEGCPPTPSRRRIRASSAGITPRCPVPLDGPSRQCVSPKVHRRLRDEEIAAEPPLAPPELPPDVGSSPLEAHLLRSARHPLAVAGVVENGLVRPLDPAVKLPERPRGIIVASAAT